MKKLSRDHTSSEYLELYATRLSFPGGRVVGKRLIADEGCHFEKSDKEGIIYLKNNNGTVTTLSCECGLEGGSCAIVIVNPGEIDEYAFCDPATGCGSSGLFCFMGFALANEMTFFVRM